MTNSTDDQAIRSIVDRWYSARKERETKEQFELELREYIRLERQQAAVEALQKIDDHIAGCESDTSAGNRIQRVVADEIAALQSPASGEGV